MENLTPAQFKALHVWCEKKALQCREAGVTVQLALQKRAELDFTKDIMKELFKSLLKAMYGKDSTKKLAKKGEIEDLVNHLNRFFAQEFHLEEIALPTKDEQ